jgi:uncharacterized protein
LPELICDTSSLQYLYQLGLLGSLRRLATDVLVPPAVLHELTVGRAEGYDVPTLEDIDWISVVGPSMSAIGRGLEYLGAGETEVLMLTTERNGAIAVLDDKLARDTAGRIGVPFTGTLGILLDLKRTGLVDRITPLLDRLQELRFRLAPSVRSMILHEAGE